MTEEVKQAEVAEVKATKVKGKKGKRVVTSGQVHIKATFNNTIISVSDKKGQVLSQSSAGANGFRGSKKGTAYAAQIAAEKAGEIAKKDHGLSSVDVYVKGIGLGRDSAIRAFLAPKAHKIMAKKSGIPGQHGDMRVRGGSLYLTQLREKQKVRRLYGLLEKQFAKLMKEAQKAEGLSGQNLLEFLERRADNVVFRAGFATTRRQARQLVSHGHFLLNGRRIDIPSIRLKTGDVLEVREKSVKSEYFKNLENTVAASGAQPLSWLKTDAKKMRIEITGTPKREEAEAGINEQLIVEYYSR